MEKKAFELELKDFNAGSRTAVIAHAVYNNIDRTGDISCKGMFNKSWMENKSIDFLFNHEEGAVTGSVTRTFEDEQKAYTEVKFGNWTLGNDVMEMADAGVLKGASFGYVTEKKDFVDIKGKKVRKLLEVKHIETSLLTVLPANPLAGVVSLTKAFNGAEFKRLTQEEQDLLKQIAAADMNVLSALMDLSGSLDVTSDLYTWINWNISRRAEMIGDLRSQIKYNAPEIGAMKAYIGKVDAFCRNSKASDEAIIKLSEDVMEAKRIITEFDTAFTHVASEPKASDMEPILQALLKN